MQNDHKEVQPMKRKNTRKCKKRHHKKFENNNSQKETKVVKLKEMLTAAFKIHDVQFSSGKVKAPVCVHVYIKNISLGTYGYQLEIWRFD